MSRAKFIAVLQRANGWKLWATIFTVTILAVEAIVASLDMLFYGHVIIDDMIKGFVATAIVEPIHLLFVVFMLGEFSKAERRSLQLSEQHATGRFNIAIEHSQMIVWELDFITGALRYEDDMLRLFGIPEGTVARDLQSWLTLVHVDDRERFVALYQQIMTSSEGTFDYKYRLAHPQGQLCWVHTRGKVIQRDGSGQPLLAVGSTINTTREKQAELKLQEQQRRFELIFNHSPDLMLISRLSDGHITEVNDALLAASGYSREEVIGKTTIGLNMWRNAADRQKMTDALQRYGRCKDIVAEFTAKDGTVFTSSISSGVTMLNGEQHIVSTVRDITERKQYEEALLASERKLSAILDNVDAYIYLKDTEGRYLFANRPVLELWQVGLDEVVGRDDSQFFDADTVENIKRNDARVLRDGATVRAEETNTVPSTGATATFLSTKLPLLREDGSIYALCGISTDISRRKQVEDSLMESERRLHQALNAANMGVWEYDFVTKKLYWSDEIYRYLGIEHVEPSREYMETLLHPEDAAIPHEAMGKALNEGVAYFAEYRLVVNGKTFWAEDRGEVQYDAKGNPLKVVGTAQDSTVRKLAEEAFKQLNIELEQRVQERTAQLQYANKAKDSFLATMSHEIRTPLGGMLGMLELLGLTHLDKDQHDTLQVAGQSGQSLLRIVDDILDWSKIEAGKLQLSPRPSSVEELVRGVVDTYSQLANAKNLMLHQQVDPHLTGLYVFDPLRVSQILNNFTSNAIKFTAQGSVRVIAQLLARHDGKVTVRLSVIDSGAGIGRQQQARLFQHYEQASADTARMYGGTGLGLSICRNLAELMDATIQVESSPGKGSTFSLMLDLEVAAPQADSGANPSTAPVRDPLQKIEPLVAAGRSVTLLIVDDHPVNRLLLKQQLGLLGLQVEAAADGVDALALWCEGQFALVITDCHMPRMDGYTLTERIRAAEADSGKRVPIIAWTANALAEEEERCRRVGMDDILTKPTNLSELRNKLAIWLPPVVLSRQAAEPASRNAPPAILAVLDMKVLEKFSTQADEQTELLRVFDKQNQIDLAHLRDAAQSGEAVAVKSAAHRVKGASRMLGALQLEHICASIQAAAERDDMAEVRRLVREELDDKVLRLRRLIQARMV